MARVTKLYIDFETCSTADLRRTGAHRYAKDATTQIICMAYAFDDEPVQVWTPNDPFPTRVRDHVLARRTIHAWNAGGFEEVIWNEHLMPYATPNYQQWRCTMIKAAYWGLPMSLEQAGAALHLPIQKDMAGKRLMLQMSRPRADKVSFWHQTDTAKLERLKAYCMQDVEAERLIDKELLDLPPDELALWQLDRKMNARGLLLDARMVTTLGRLVIQEQTTLRNECGALTGYSPTQTGPLLAWINARWIAGPSLPDLTKATVAAALARPMLEPKARRALEIRQEYAKASTAKLTAMLNAADPDGYIRGLTQFYGATRTGRWAGRLVQIQNLPRPTIKHVDWAVRDILSGQHDVEYIRDMYGRPLEVVSSLLRSCFVPGPDEHFIVGDFSQIEARMIAWLAGQTDILRVFASGQDPYVYTAKKVGSDNRQFGKVLVLACGFGMGGNKFQETAKTYGITLTPLEAQSAVSAWRGANPKIVRFWYSLDDAVRAALSEDMKTVFSCGVNVGMGRGKLSGCLLIQLPSGRYLTYRNARLRDDGEARESIVYEGMNQYTRQWEDVRTYGGKLAENITQAAARDVMAQALTNLRPAIITPRATVHDEIICTAQDRHSHEAYDHMKRVMSAPVLWAPNLPVAADVKIMFRYGKG